MGWKGICVEAHPDYYTDLKKNRDSSLTRSLHCAVGDKNGDVEFYANYRGSLSTLNPDLNEFYKKNYKGYYLGSEIKADVNGYRNGKLTIKGNTLDNIIEENRDILGDSIDFMTIDVDGSEELLLKEFTILKSNPRIIMLEYSVVPQVVIEYMKNTKYELLFYNSTNLIYCRDVEDKLKFNSTLRSYDFSKISEVLEKVRLKCGVDKSQ